ncbi:MAG: DctP family TRAP transporter solute-binding subunit [Betaproteobacteria bacterium]|nr:MAG: DctP family TRAP transporter solute-binding subunit [Betaproteobacteria bacterium]
MKLVQFAGAVIASALFTGAQAQQPASQSIVVKFSHVVADETPKGKGAIRFKELAEAKTKGRVKVEVYPNSQLYKDREELEALQLGAVQMLAPSVSKFGPLGVRKFEVFDLPYMFPDNKSLEHVVEGPVGTGLFKLLEPKGIVGLAYWFNGFKEFTANRPLRKLDDFKGMKIRIQSSKILEGEIKAFGAIPQVMAFSEVYTANTPSNKYTQKMHEVQKHMTLSDHGVVMYAVIVNKKFWDGLPADIRKALSEAMAEATKYVWDIARRENEDALAKIKAAKTTEVYVLPPAEKAAWRKAMLPLYREYEGVVGKDTLQAIEKTVAQSAVKK